MKKTRGSGSIVLVPCLLLTFVILSCAPGDLPIQAEKGIMDLTSLDLEEAGIIELGGEWEFYWETFLTHEDFKTPRTTIQPDYQQAPGIWYTYTHNNKKLPLYGYATFRLVVILPEESKIYGFKLIDTSTAYKMYVDGNYIMGNGNPGKNKEETIPRWRSETGLYVPKSRTMEIILHISNYHYNKAGFWKSLFFGPEKYITAENFRAKTWDFFILGIYLAIGIYHLVLFFLGRNDKSTLFFGIFCIFFTIRTQFTGERTGLYLFPWINWHLGIIIEFVSVYFLVIFFILFLKTLYPGETVVIINRIIIIISLAFTGIFLFFSPTLSSSVHFLYTLFMLPVIVYVTIVLIFASIRNRVGALFLVVGFFFFAITVFYDILVSEFIINTNFLSPIGILFFILTEFALYIKFIKAEEELREREKELLQAEKLASLGTLIAGVAHEINNPNSSISLTTSTLIHIWKDMESQLEEFVESAGDFYVGSSLYSDIKNDIPESLQRIMRNSQRIKVIVKDLKDYAKKDESNTDQRVNINEVITSSLHLLENLIKKSTAHFVLSLANDLPPVMGNPQRLEQVILNVIQNACQALESRDKEVAIETRYDSVQHKVIITVKDQGVGMNKKTISQIYDPFFTTKRANGGTGLGMAVSSRIIHNHGGLLKIKSKPGKGTTIEIILNIMEKET